MKTTKIVLSILLALMVVSCNYLDVVPDNIPTIDMAFTTRQNAEKFLKTCYSRIPPYGNVWRNPGMETGDEVWLCAERTYYYANGTSFPIAKGNQNVGEPYLNYWSGGNDGTNLFIAIRDCNIFLDEVDNVPDMTESERSRWKAEIKVLKAFYHYYLMQLYGPIPVIRENLPIYATPEEVKVVREPVDDVAKYIVGLIDEATIDKTGSSSALPLNIRVESELGRLTLPAALAIKAKILTLVASPLFNGNPDFVDYKNAEGNNFINPVKEVKKWEAARDACKEAIDYADIAGNELYEFNDVILNDISDTTRLELTLRNTITAEQKNNKEMIWGYGNDGTAFLQAVSNAPLTPYQQGKQISWCVSMHNPTLNVVEEFYTKNGLPIDEDKTYDYNGRYDVGVVPAGHQYYIEKDFRTAKLNFYREPRYYAYLGFDGGKWFNLEAANDKNSYVVRNKALQTAGRALENYSITGYFAKKLVSYKLIMTESQNTGSSVSYTFPIIRLSDIYLLYAEALNECLDVPNNEVYQYIQLVRNKAGLDKETGSLVQTWETYSTTPDKPKSKNGMREIIRRERLIEFAFEGQRFFDLRRWRLSMDYLNRPIRGWNVSQSTELGYYQVNYIYNRKFTTKDYFWPLKTNDLYVNDKLIQSYGW